MKLIDNLKYFLYFLFNNLINESKISTHLTNDEKVYLNKIIKKINKDNPVALEIGSYIGASSCFLANSLTKQNGKLYCIDTWQNDSMTEGEKDTYKEFKKNTARYEKVIIPLRGYSYNVVKEFENYNKKIDILFIDGDHSYEGCKTDWQLYSSYLNKNAVIIFHDTGWAEGVKKVINEYVLNKADQIVKLSNMEIYELKKND